MWTRKGIATLAAKTSVRMTSVSLLSFAIGATSSYFVSSKLLKTKYEALAEKEIEEARKFYGHLQEKKPIEDIVTEMAAYSNQVENLDYGVKSNPEEPETDSSLDLDKVITQVEEEADAMEENAPEEVKNIFEEAKSEIDFDYDEELKHRTPDEPYIVSQEEFFINDGDYGQTSSTYYEGDDVLADERDQMINDIEGTVGEENLLHFGHGSNDPNVVYIRNERIELDFEVLRSEGEYSKEVLGFIEHAYQPPKVRKFRSDDG